MNVHCGVAFQSIHFIYSSSLIILQIISIWPFECLNEKTKKLLKCEKFSYTCNFVLHFIDFCRVYFYFDSYDVFTFMCFDL